jgi:hypothetical protein
MPANQRQREVKVKIRLASLGDTLKLGTLFKLFSSKKPSQMLIFAPRSQS